MNLYYVGSIIILVTSKQLVEFLSLITSINFFHLFCLLWTYNSLHVHLIWRPNWKYCVCRNKVQNADRWQPILLLILGCNTLFKKKLAILLGHYWSTIWVLLIVRTQHMGTVCFDYHYCFGADNKSYFQEVGNRK